MEVVLDAPELRRVFVLAFLVGFGLDLPDKLQPLGFQFGQPVVQRLVGFAEPLDGNLARAVEALVGFNLGFEAADLRLAIGEARFGFVFGSLDEPHAAALFEDFGEVVEERRLQVVGEDLEGAFRAAVGAAVAGRLHRLVAAAAPGDPAERVKGRATSFCLRSLAGCLNVGEGVVVGERQHEDLAQAVGEPPRRAPFRQPDEAGVEVLDGSKLFGAEGWTEMVRRVHAHPKK
ncbi:MAG: hypothetical protein R3F11_07265 [Verrucomicrobiales bacterium]